VRLLLGLFPRLNLFAFTVPVFPGDQFADLLEKLHPHLPRFLSLQEPRPEKAIYLAIAIDSTEQLSEV